MDKRQLKDLLYEQVARVGRALASPRRLEILELLAQGEKSVESLTAELGIDVKSTSAHLKTLKAACLVQFARNGKYMVYRLSSDGVAQLGVALRAVASEHLQELRLAMHTMLAEPAHLQGLGRRELLARVRRGEVLLIDVRPRDEFVNAHLMYARSMPLGELEQHLRDAPRDRPIVAYCRGPFCLLSDAAVQRLLQLGFDACKLSDGVSEWRARGLPIATKVTVRAPVQTTAEGVA
jgi:rhodanese-related sulfurtransferase/DNA-binding transcriptional ArsR family regulator